MIHLRNVCLAGVLAALLADPLSGQAQSVADYAVRISAAVLATPPRIILTWPGDTAATGYSVYRKTRDATTWGPGTMLAANATTYVDTNVTIGGTYEYRITKSASGYTGYGYIYAGIEAPLIETRGKVILLVDDTQSTSLARELARLEQDLVGDGWIVLRHDVSPTASVPSVKSLIESDYNADPTNVRALFLFGHVPVPYSGNLNPDGHSNHRGAWPADVFYGDMDGHWTDTSVTNTTASSTRNHNVPGDGKYDQSSLPSDVELELGRVDLANLPAFALSETELLRQYLNKDHNFRHKFVTAQPRGLIDDNFGTFSGEAFAVNGWRNIAACFGAGNTFARDWFTTLATGSYLWGYGCGGGSYTSAGGVGSTADFAASDPQVVFTMLFGSFFGDWDSQNNFLRAPLATPTYALTCAWAGRPHWQFHHTALGETIGFSTRVSQNNSSLYVANNSARGVHVALMGDPTLRLQPVAPPAALTVTTKDNGEAELRWNESTDSVAGYHVYGAPAAAGPFVRLNAALIADTKYTDTVTEAAVYMVRAVKLERSSSGSYFNASQGIFQSLDGSLGAPSIAWLQPAANEVFVTPASIPLETSVVDYANRISKVEFLADGVKLGEDTAPPFAFTWTNVAVGSYVLTARAIYDGALVTNSAAVNVRVDASLVAAGAIWKYLDDGSDQGTAWRTTDFDDNAWASGPAPLGYGDNQPTIVSFGPEETNKYITTYFRRTFVVNDPAALTNLTLGLERDDGAVVYLNGTEVFRSNLPGGTIDYLTRAPVAVGGADETTFYSTNISPALLRAGANLLAVEVHQQSGTSSDLTFDLKLSGSGQQRAPELKAVRQSSQLVLSWSASTLGYHLESTDAAFGLDWSVVTNLVQSANGTNTVTVDLDGGRRFFRLGQP